MKTLILSALIILTAGTAYSQNRSTRNSHYNHYAQQEAPSGVFLNGESLTRQQAMELAYIIGVNVPRGRYYVDAYGNFGMEGYRPVVNLIQLIQQRQQAHQYASQRGSNGGTTHRTEFVGGESAYYSSSSNGEWGMSVGGCTIINGDFSC